MASKVVAYANSRGGLFGTAEGATVSDLTILLENAPLARQVFALRESIETIFLNHDAMLAEIVADAGQEY